MSSVLVSMFCVYIQADGAARCPAVFAAMVSYIRDVLDVFGIDLLHTKVGFLLCTSTCRLSLHPSLCGRHVSLCWPCDELVRPASQCCILFFTLLKETYKFLKVFYT